MASVAVEEEKVEAVLVVDDVEDVSIMVVADACPGKSNFTFMPLRVIVLVIGPKPGPEAVTVMVPEVPIGIV